MRKQPTPYSATLYVWNGVSAFFFSNCVTPFHSHNTMQLVFDIRDMFKCRTQNSEWLHCKSAVIKEDAIHQLDTNGNIQLIIYLDKNSRHADVIRSKFLMNREIASLGFDIADMIKPCELEKCLITPNPALLKKIVQRLLIAVVGGAKGEMMDDRITTVLAMLRKDNVGEIDIKTLAAEVFLSPSRLRYLFKQVTGFSLHRYIIWNRIMIAMTALLNGASISEAAFSCGFTDASHFNRMLIQMFGISPSQFIKDSSQKKLVVCSDLPFALETRSHNEITGEIEERYRL